MKTCCTDIYPYYITLFTFMFSPSRGYICPLIISSLEEKMQKKIYLSENSMKCSTFTCSEYVMETTQYNTIAWLNSLRRGKDEINFRFFFLQQTLTEVGSNGDN